MRMGWRTPATESGPSCADASRRYTRPTSKTRMRGTLREWFLRTTSIKEPIKLVRITDWWLAIGLSSRIGFAAPEKSASQAGSTKLKLITDRKSTRLNSSHVSISYAVFCLKKKNITEHIFYLLHEPHPRPLSASLESVLM